MVMCVDVHLLLGSVSVKVSGTLVSSGLLEQVLLMVVLGVPPVLDGLNVGGNGVLEPGVLQLLLHGLRGLLLLGRVGEDGRSVLRADIGALAIGLCGVVDLEEEVHQLLVRDLGGLKRHLQRLGVAGGSRTHLSVRRIVGVATRVADFGVHETLVGKVLSVDVFDAPEAAGCDCEKFGGGRGLESG